MFTNLFLGQSLGELELGIRHRREVPGHPQNVRCWRCVLNSILGAFFKNHKIPLMQIYWTLINLMRGKSWPTCHVTTMPSRAQCRLIMALQKCAFLNCYYLLTFHSVEKKKSVHTVFPKGNKNKAQPNNDGCRFTTTTTHIPTTQILIYA